MNRKQLVWVGVGELPGLALFVAFGDFEGEVDGLDDAVPCAALLLGEAEADAEGDALAEVVGRAGEEPLGSETSVPFEPLPDWPVFAVADAEASGR